MARARAYLQIEPSWTPASAARIHVQTLGACQIQIGPERISPSAETLFSLIIRVVYAPGRQVSRDVLLSALWPGQSLTRQRGSLRQALYKLRRIGVVMSMDGDQVRFDAGQIARTFAMERTAENFERDVLQEHEPFGVFLPGFEPRSEELQEFIHACREEVHSDVRRVLVMHLRSRRERADWRGAETMSRWLLQFDPLNEEATLTLAECMALSGGKAQALEMIDRYLDELGPDAGDIRLPASMLRKRLVDPGPRKLSFAPSERHFVGREEELSELTQAMRRARWHDGSAYLIHGPPGMGKTRLTLELAKVATIEGMLQLRYSCRESDSLRPLSLALELVSELLASPGALGCAPETLAHLRRLVGEEPPVFGPDGIPLPREPLPSPAAIRRGIADIVAAVGEEKPIFLVVDDVHWLDRQSWDVLADLIERAEATRVCVLMTSRQAYACAQRPERVPGRMVSRELKRLSEGEALTLVTAMAPSLSEGAEAYCREIVVRSDGLPLFVRSLTSHFVEFGDRSSLPDTLLELLDRRLDSLGSAPLRALQLIALLHTRTDIDLIRSCLQISIVEMTGVLDELGRLGISIDDEGSMEAHHYLLERAAARLNATSDRFLRRQLATALSNRAQHEQSDDLLVLAAEHWTKCGDTARAVSILISSGEELLANCGAHKILALLNSLNPEAATNSEHPVLHALRRKALFSIGAYSQLLSITDSRLITSNGNEWDIKNPEEALRLIVSANYADAHSPSEVIARAIMMAESTRIETQFRLEAARAAIEAAGDYPYPDLARRAYDAACNTPPNSLADELLKLRIEMYFHAPFGSLERAIIAANTLLDRKDEFKVDENRLFVLQHVAICLRFAGDYQKARTILEEITRAAPRIGMVALACRAFCRLAYIQLEVSSDDELAWSYLEKAEKINNGDSYIAAQIEYNRARILANRGKHREARRHLQLADSSSSFRHEPRSGSYCAAVELAVLDAEGDFEAIRALLSTSMQNYELIKRFTGQDYHVAQLLRAMRTCAFDAETGRSLILDYLTARSERAPLPHFLERELREWSIEAPLGYGWSP